MTRIEPVADKPGNPFIRLTFQQTGQRLGRVPAPIRVLARAPAVLAGNVAMELAFERSHRVEERLKGLAEVKVATMVGCEFCIDIGSMIGLKSGIAERQLRELHDYAVSDAFDVTERLVLDLAVGMASTPVEVSGELWTSLRERFDEPALVELVAIIGWENFRARTNHALGLGSEGFSDGQACAVAAPPAGATRATAA